MDTRLQTLINLAFDGLPYSRETGQARQRVLQALEEKYAALQNRAEGDAFEELSARYASLTAMAALAGYDAATVRGWRSTEKLVTRNLAIRQSRLSAFFFTLYYFLFLFLLSRYVNRTLSALMAMAFYALWVLLRRRPSRRYDTAAYDYLRGRIDLHIKRSMVAEALFFLVLGLYILSTLFSAFPDQAKQSETLHVVRAYGAYFGAALYLCLFCRVRLFQCRDLIAAERARRINRHFRLFGAFSLLYWALATTALFLLFRAHFVPVMPFVALYVFYLLAVLYYTLVLRRRITDRNIAISKKRLTAAIALLLIFALIRTMYKDTWYTQPYINTTPIVVHGEYHIDYDEETGVYTLTSAQDDFKILQLTDIHLGGSLTSVYKDLLALEACFRLIEHTHPDLVIVTGDLSYPVGISSLSFNNRAPVAQFAAFMRNMGVPWAFTFGNHDTESFAAEADLSGVFQSLSFRTSGNLLFPYRQPDISGRNNQLIEIRNRDGTLNQALFLIDSNAYLGLGFSNYDCIHDDQVEWYAQQVRRLCQEEGHLISSLAFFHIPLQQYRTAWQLYEQGSDEVTYFFGENGETLSEKVCCSQYPSSFFDTARSLGSTRAMFCGHDHFNNISLEYQGIRLTYGMSIDYLATPGTDQSDAQRGATLITLHRDSTYDIEQVPFASLP